MIINRKRIEKLISSFLIDHNLVEYSLGELRIVDDTSPNNDTIATITINQVTKHFFIRLWSREVGSYREAMAAIIHELTHLYLHEVSDFYEYMDQNGAQDHIKKHYITMYETITCRLAKLFEQHYLEGV